MADGRGNTDSWGSASPHIGHGRCLTAANDVLNAAHESEVESLRQTDSLTVRELTARRLKAEIGALKAGYEEGVETLRQRWEKEANQSECQKAGHAE
ncbi:hypothetical protein E8E12_004319 [Didymella heteroderae]|uniref:Uncharacterized protein n=1 Tax=Didymella heteroderae TaxID=1769908 RepID=A0A9P4X022_9PLEO|nr:hypothetical protein E8E12_004319 [Didymella heteroderae]